MLVMLAAVIAFALILFQKKGTEKVSSAFAPIMFIWFCFLGIFGFIYIMQYPHVLVALNPYYALHFLFSHGFLGFFTLSEVILCATGGEALYADMGHMRRRPITQAWVFVFIALALNYIGQASFLIQHPHTKNILFGMIFHQAPVLYIPFLILSVLATVIASQAMITGIFSIVYQAINVRLLPMLRISYTSDKIKEQIYIGTINWFLLIFVILIMFIFKDSDKLAAAYGLAVTGAMVLAGIMMIMIFYIRKNYIKMFATVFATFVAGVFFSSTLLKIPYGGYWSLILSCIPLSIILIYTLGQKRMFSKLNPVRKDDFLDLYRHEYKNMSKIDGTALYLLH
jgi:KUP system potassium uptake protein